jgi:hypothetical protein
MNEKQNVVYIAHPLRPDPRSVTPYGDCQKNIAAVTAICERLLKEYPDLLILSPIHAFGFIDPLAKGKDVELVLAQCRRLLELADEVWVYGDYEISEGCKMEIAHAKALEKPVRLMLW